jgi:hypothetical protein
MKKIIFLSAFMCSFSLLQAQIYPKGSVNFSAGYGAITFDGILLRIFSDDLENIQTQKTGPLFFKGEYAIVDNLTLGVNVNFSNLTGSFTMDSIQYVGNYSGTLGIRSTSILGRVNYTFPFADDRGGFMIGGGLGYRGFRVSYEDNNPQTPLDRGFSIPAPFTFEGTLGVKYYFTPNIGAYVEAGVTRSILQGGLTVRF